MKKKILPSFRLYMFDYKNPWKMTLIFEFLFFAYFVVLTRIIDINLIYQAFDINRIQDTSYNNMKNYFLFTLIPAISHIIFIYILSGFCSIVYFGTVEINLLFKKINDYILNKVGIKSFLLFILVLIILSIFPKLTNGRFLGYFPMFFIGIMVIFSFYYQMKYFNKFLFFKYLILIEGIISVVYIIYKDGKYINNIYFFSVLIVLFLVYILLINFFLLTFFWLIRIIILVALAEYKSADLGKILLQKKIKIDNIKEYLNKNNIEFDISNLYKKIHSPNFIEVIIEEIFKIK